MKFNLKDRPDCKQRFNKVLSYEEWLNRIEEWFEGFEQELRERSARLKETIDDKRTDSDMTRYLMIQEILGE